MRESMERRKHTHPNPRKKPIAAAPSRFPSLFLSSAPFRPLIKSGVRRRFLLSLTYILARESVGCGGGGDMHESFAQKKRSPFFARGRRKKSCFPILLYSFIFLLRIRPAFFPQ